MDQKKGEEEKSKSSGPPIVPVVPPHIEEALLNRLKQRAREKCKEQAEKYVDCTKNRVFSIVWKCRGFLKELNDCLGAYTRKTELDRLKIEWTKLQKEKEMKNNKTKEEIISMNTNTKTETTTS